MSVTIRPHRTSDAAETLAVFFAAIRTTAAADYSAEQIEVWADPDIDLPTWTAKRAELNTAVAVVNGAVAGFTDVDETGYIHMLFVDPVHGRTGVATALLRWVLDEAKNAGARCLTTNASITARPFFQNQGFVVAEERHPVLRGVALRNYRMIRTIA